MLSTVLSDPFATSHPPLVLATLAALQTTMVVCWPRLGQGLWRNEILKALVLCWLHFGEEEGDRTTRTAPPQGEEQLRADQREQVKEGLVRTAAVLSAMSASARSDLNKDIAPMLTKEPSLRPLFGIS
jgi:hypothetical protein